jgi:hypothetical protein
MDRTRVEEAIREAVRLNSDDSELAEDVVSDFWELYEEYEAAGGR